mmetsp:Transcript_5100/g.6275  ORF Transcript_5100/g.6275 Transcript_5100/m.6275 type:complete len:106 (+) Transcript_5100:37-354(+)|eukprot:jgi/Bigna1/131427/aug1.14_g6135
MGSENFRGAMGALETAEMQVIRLIHYASQIANHCSKVTPEGARDAKDNLKKYMETLKALQQRLKICIERSPVGLENTVNCHEEHLKFRLAAEACDVLLDEISKPL